MLRSPAQLLLDLGGIDGVAHVMPRAVAHMADQPLGAPLRAPQSLVHETDQGVDHLDILSLAVTANIVRLAYSALMVDQIYRRSVVIDIEPVAYLTAVAVDRQLTLLTDVIDEEWDKLLGVLVGAVVIGAIGDQRRQPVGVVEGADKVVA